VASVIITQSQIAQSTGTGSFNESFSTVEQTTNAYDDSLTTGSSGTGGDDRLGKDWGSGVTKTMSGFKIHTATATGFNYGASTIRFVAAGSTNNSTWVDIGDTGVISDIAGASDGTTNVSLLTGFTTTTAYRYHRVKFVGVVSDIRFTELYFYEDAGTASATGTLISDTQTAPSATTEASGVILYKDNGSSSTVLGTHLKIYFTADNGSNWTEAASYGTAQTFSGTTKQVKLGKTTGLTSGTQVAMKAVWAGQASITMETQLHGWAVNY
jgi:hypothetical protein